MVVVDQRLVVVVGAYIRPDPWPSAHNSPRELALNGHGTICPWHAGMRAWHDICFAAVSEDLRFFDRSLNMIGSVRHIIKFNKPMRRVFELHRFP